MRKSVLALTITAAGLFSCGGGGEEVIGGPGVPWIDGQYVTMSREEVTNTCGFSTSFHQEPWLIMQDLTSDGYPMGHARIRIRDTATDDGCADIGIYLHDGRWEYEAAGQGEDAGCTYDWTAHGVVESSDEGLALTETLHYASRSGTCEGWTPPCDYSHRFSAVACDGCWPGCTTITATGRTTTLP